MSDLRNRLIESINSSDIRLDGLEFRKRVETGCGSCFHEQFLAGYRVSTWIPKADISVGSGYLFPKTDAPVYIKGNAICTSLSIAGMLTTFVYQFLIWRENRARDRKEGKPAPDLQPDTLNHADDAIGFRYTA